MADNVNIIVQDTINDIVVNAAVVVETIDINVQAAVDVVDIVANPNNYVVNINRIIGEQVQSDWTQNDNQAPDYIKNKPTLAAVATSGDYNDLINTPTIPTATSDLTNDGENGVDPFITAADIPATPTLQQVTDAGNETGNQIKSFGGAGESTIDGEKIYTTDFGLDSHAYLHSGGYLGLKSLNALEESYLANNLVEEKNIILEFPNKPTGNYTIATTEDIPSVTGFVPYTGATQDVNLGEFGLLTGNVEFDTTPTNIPTTAGAMYWNDADGTADLILKGGNVKLQVGQESVIRVVNKTATNINLLEANYQAVRVTGAQGQRLKVDLAQATTDNLSAETIGLVTETINNNQEGFITTSGLVRNINTTGSLQGETWADGDILYLSPTTAGRVTKVKPTAPNHLVIIGYVVHAHANQGSIFVKVDNGYELDELHNVKITSAANNNVLAYTSATDIWENKTVETALGYTPQQQLVSGTNIKTINGASVLGSGDLVVGGSTSLAIGTTPITSGTIGRVLFQGTGDVLQQSADLFWNNTNGSLTVSKNQNAGTDIIVSNTTNGTAAISRLRLINNDSREAQYFITPAAYSAYGALGASTAGLYTNVSGGFAILADQFGPIRFITGSGSGNTEKARFVGSTGNFLINTTTDAGFRLDVNGTARVNGNATFGTLGTGTGMFWDNANNRLGIGTATPSNLLSINTNQNSTQGIFVTNSNTGNNARSIIRLVNNNGNLAQLSIWGSGTGLPNKTFFEASKDFVIGTDADVASGGTSKFQIYVGGFNAALNPQFTFHSTANLSIGTSTDAGYRLDVNGTARVSGQITGGSASLDGQATSGTSLGIKWMSISGSSGRYIYNSSTNSDLLAFSGGKFALQSASVTSFSVGSFGIAATGTGNVGILGGGTGAGSANVTVGYTASSSLTTGSNNVAIGEAALYNVSTNSNNVAIGRYAGTSSGSNASANHSQSIFIGSGTGWASGGTALTNTTIIGYNLRTNLSNVFMLGRSDQTILVGEGTTVGSGAILQIDSTTKGFLPPRMTTTQKNAIATPAAGLMIYDNTLNRPCFYDGTTWITL